MKVVNANDKLLEKPPSLALFETALSDNILKHVATSYKLHGNCQVPRRQKDLVKQYQ